MTTARRLLLLASLAAAGALVGVAGLLVFGSQLGFLAVPALVALGWLHAADPTACEPADKR